MSIILYIVSTQWAVDRCCSQPSFLYHNTHTQNDYRNPPAHALRVNKQILCSLSIKINAFTFDNVFAFNNTDTFDSVFAFDNSDDVFAFDNVFMPHFDHACMHLRMHMPCNKFDNVSEFAHAFVIKLTMYLSLPMHLPQI